MNQPVESNEIVKTVENFYASLKKHTNHRYMSWEDCFNAFKSMDKSDVDYFSLHLAFYLASWGMYRGSSALLWKDYRVHNEAVVIIKAYSNLQCKFGKEVDDIENIFRVKEELENHYKSIYYIKPKSNDSKEGSVSPTKTLITKILLGTLGCVPAYDRLLVIGFKGSKINKGFNEKSLKSIFEFINNNLVSLKEIQSRINSDGSYYPLMKIVDMYFWEIGRIQNPQLIEVD